MPNIKTYPQVGVGVMILKEGKILLAKRKGSHGEGYYAFPGGHLEYLESFEDCATREISEECGIKVKNVRFLYLANITRYVPKHYVNICLLADWESGEPQLLEPTKAERWDWYDIHKDLPHPLMDLCYLAIKSYTEKVNYFDTSESNIDESFL